MRCFIILLISLVVALCPDFVYGQRSSVTKSRYHRPPPKVRGKKARTICPVFTNSIYPFHGLGVKIGDPFALTYKFYARKQLAFVVDLGKVASGLYRAYYRELFNEYVSEDSLSSTSAPSYVAHQVRSDMIAEAKVLYQIDASRWVEGLQFYAGGGGAWKSTELHYDYERSVRDVQGPEDDPFGSLQRRRVTLGVQAVAGLEYAYFSMPVALFMEVQYYTDLYADPGWQKLQGGVGLRYIFSR